MQSTQDKTLSRIYGYGRGAVVSPTDFLDLGSRAAVDKALARLAEAGTLRRLTRGLYEYPKTHPVLGTLAPVPEKVARALAGKAGGRLQPTGAYAANLLGLTEQVPAKIVFLTDGLSKTVRIGAQQIQLKRISLRDMATAGRMSGLVFQALRHLGPVHVDERVVERLQRQLTPKDKAQLLDDLPLAPTWMEAVLRQVANQSL